MKFFTYKRRHCVCLVFLVIICVFSIYLGSCSDAELPTDAEYVTFTDALHREVSIPKNPKRVASLLGSFSEVWQLSGGTLCASADDAWDDFHLEMGDAINLGATKSPSIELLFASDPDFVIASASTAADVEMREVLENAGIPVAYFDVACFAEYLEMLDVCTDITGRKDLYEENGLRILAEIEEIKASFETSKPPYEKQKILFLRASAGYIRAKNSEGSVLGEMLHDLGCVNIADNDSSLLETLSVEAVIREEPYHIFIVQVGDDGDAVRKNVSRMMEENPAWGELSAVKNGRLHFMDKRLFNLKPNARWAEAYDILCNILQN